MALAQPALPSTSPATCVQSRRRREGRSARGRGLCVRTASGVVVGDRTTDVRVTHVQACPTLWVIRDLCQDHQQRVPVVILFPDDSDAALLERQVLGLLTDLHVRAGLFFDLLDVVAGFADDHAGGAIWHENFHLREEKKKKYIA